MVNAAKIFLLVLKAQLKLWKNGAEALKIASKRPMQRTTEATDDLIGNKITDAVDKTIPITRLQALYHKIPQASQIHLCKQKVKKKTKKKTTTLWST